MQQLELFPIDIRIFTPLEQLARHMRMFRISFTYDELQEWHTTANKLAIKVREDAIQNAYDNIELPEADD